MSHRTDRVGDLVRAELAELLLRKVRDPRARSASIGSVRMTGDLKRATIFVSVLGDESGRQDAVEALTHARGFLRSELARRLPLRTAPELVFRLDRGAEHSQRISDLLESLDVNSDNDGA